MVNYDNIILNYHYEALTCKQGITGKGGANYQRRFYFHLCVLVGLFVDCFFCWFAVCFFDGLFVGLSLR